MSKQDHQGGVSGTISFPSPTFPEGVTMKLENIRVGMVLRLKRSVLDSSVHCDDTAFTSDLITVTAIRPHPGYVVPWIMGQGLDAFKPSNFVRAV